MRIFKNRGDIFFSKTNKERSAEQRFLLFSLAAVLVFSLVFVTVVAVRNDFSVKTFFAPEEPAVTQLAEETESVVLPQISGKTNYLLTVAEEDELLFVVLVQADCDNTALKASCLRADTVCDGKGLNEIYAAGGVQNVRAAVETLLQVETAYYIAFAEADFISLYNELGEMTYTAASAVRFREKDSAVPYNLRLREGEQKLKGSQLVALLRYELDEEENTAAANEVVLSLLTQQLNAENYENADALFRSFIAAAQTNITVREYSMAGDRLLVFSHAQTGVHVYSAAAEYTKNSTLTKESIQTVRGYFVN